MMLPPTAVLSSLAFLAFTYPATSFAFREGVNKKIAFISFVSIALVAVAIKIGYEFRDTQPNYYTILGVPKRSSALEVRQSYKRVSRTLHPDKNTAPDAEGKFRRAKFAYDVLMDDSQRDIYNRFGEGSLDFDPRRDELKLLSKIGARYVFWAVVTYIATLPYGARASRTWTAIVLIGMLVLEVTLQITESSLPDWMPSQLTEYDFITLLHISYPAILSFLRALSEFFYVDIDRLSVAALSELISHQKAIQQLFHELQVVLKVKSTIAEGYSAHSKQQITAERIDDVGAKLVELRSYMEQSEEHVGQTIEILKHSSSNPGSNYYWLIFVFLYAGVYLFQ